MVRSIKLAGCVFKIKQLSPIDFLEDDNGVPFNIFIVKKEKTRDEVLSEKLNTPTNDPDEQDIDKQTKLIINILTKGVLEEDDRPFDPLGYIVKKKDTIFDLLTSVLDISLKKFNKIYEIKEEQVYLYYKIATEFGCTPIDILFPDKNYTELDAYLFNSFIWAHVTAEQIKTMEKANKKMALNKAKLGLRRL